MQASTCADINTTASHHLGSAPSQLHRLVPKLTSTAVMPRKSSAVPIRNPSTGQPVAELSSSSDWPALPPDPKLSWAAAGAQTTVNKPYVAPHLLRARHQAPLPKPDQDQEQETVPSTNPPPQENNDSDKLERARREAREAIVTLNLTSNVNKNAVAQPSEARDDVKEPFNIYARPFIPRATSIINTLNGRVIYTPHAKGVRYDEYTTAAFGPASGFLPNPPHPNFIPPGTAAARPPVASLDLRHYEAFFQRRLQQEVEAQRNETDACSLYGHKVTISPPSDALGDTICTLEVPGLRENSPWVEEDDLVYMRQLVYEDGTTVLRGMVDWLKLKDVFESNRLQPSPWQDEAPGWTHIIYHARVLGVVRATETLHLRVAGSPFNTKEGRFNIQFEVPVGRNMPMDFAVADVQCTLHHGGWMNSMLFPTNADPEIQEKLHTGVWNQKFFDKDLNWEQKKAVESSLLRAHGTLPYLISGPPGTGKTKTVIEIVLQMVRSSTTLNHVLLCAPSDPAADTLCMRLKDQLGPAEMLRLNRPCRTFAEVPDSLLPYCCVQENTFGLPPLERLVKFRVVVTTCRDSAMLLRARVTNRDICAVQRGMRNVSAVLTPYDRLSEIKLHWAGLLLDEAAQAMEPEALIPLTIIAPPIQNDHNSSAPVVVMAGDEHQLGPRTVLPDSELRESLFARLFKRPVYADHPLARGKKGEAPPPLTKALLPVLRPAFANLIRNYRSHPAILAVPSNLFYWDTLEPEAKDTDRLAGWEGWQGRRWPVLFHDNQSLDDLELPGMMEGAGGWINPGEAAVACGYAQSLVRSGLVTQAEVCIMSPFKSQVRVLRETIRRQDMWAVNIGPTEAFQGLERGVVILCVTRARQRFVPEDQKLGWGIIGMPNKMNVALTRAKYGLIVVGNRDVLMEDPNWKAFLEFCDRNGLVAPSEATTNGENNGHGGAPLGDQTLTRQEKVMLERERIKKMSEAAVWRKLCKEQAGAEMHAYPDDYDEAADDSDDDGGYGHNGY